MKDPWSIKKEDFPYNGNLTEKIKFILGYAILAPSTHNSQPWLFEVQENSVKIYYDNSLRLPQADPIGRDLYISLGCLLENLLIASNYFGIFNKLVYKIEGNCIAEVTFQDEGLANPDLGYLVDTITKRVNSRGIFKDRVLSDGIQAQLLSLNQDSHLTINFITDLEKIKRAAYLTARGQEIAHGKTSFRKEMYRWMHSSLTTKKYGMPGYSLKMPFLLSFFIPVLIRFFDMSPLLAKLNYKSMASASMICVINADSNSELIWLNTGRLAERLMLQIQSQGISTSIFVASIEMSELYHELQEIVGTNLLPQFLFCVGYMDYIQKHSPRYDLPSKIMK